MSTTENQPAITPEEFRAWMQEMRTTQVMRSVGYMCTSFGSHCALGLLGLMRGYTPAPQLAAQWKEQDAATKLWAVNDMIMDATGYSVADTNDGSPTLSWAEIADKLEAFCGVNFERVEAYYAN
jgi:hypothetical protein